MQSPVVRMLYKDQRGAATGKTAGSFMDDIVRLKSSSLGCLKLPNCAASNISAPRLHPRDAQCVPNCINYTHFESSTIVIQANERWKARQLLIRLVVINWH